jgi:hypothetical protein
MGQQVSSALRQSMHRVVLVLANFLPGIVAFLLAVLFFVGLGWLLSALLRRILTSLRFDDRLSARQPNSASATLADWSPSHSPTLLASRSVFWVCVLIGFAVGLSAFDASYATNSEISIFVLPYLTHITGAILLVLAGSILARFLARSVLIGAVNAQMQYARFLSLGVKWLVLVLTLAMALDHLQIGGHIVELAFGILFGGIVLTLALAIGLGSRDLVSRSIEKNIERPFVAKPPEPQPVAEVEATRSRFRHF